MVDGQSKTDMAESRTKRGRNGNGLELLGQKSSRLCWPVPLQIGGWWDRGGPAAAAIDVLRKAAYEADVLVQENVSCLGVSLTEMLGLHHGPAVGQPRTMHPKALPSLGDMAATIAGQQPTPKAVVAKRLLLHRLDPTAGDPSKRASHQKPSSKPNDRCHRRHPKHPATPTKTLAKCQGHELKSVARCFDLNSL